MPKAAELARRALEIRERALNDKVITPDNDDLLSSYYQMASMCVQNSEHVWRNIASDKLYNSRIMVYLFYFSC